MQAGDQIRLDKVPMPQVSRTSEGYLRGTAVVTRTGVFKYQNADGTIRRELRHPDDIITDASIATMQQIPMTVDHPAALVNADTAHDLSVGMTGENVRADGANIVAPFTITHKTGIDAVEAGRRELSLGYRLDLVEEQGEYNGERYDYRQTNVSYNHLAIVAKARAGAEARIHLDGASVLIETDPQEAYAMTVKVNLDGIEYDAAPEVKKALDKAQERADAAEQGRADAAKERDTITAERDTAQANLDAAKEEIETLKAANNDEAIAEAAKERIALLGKAGKLVNVDDVSDKTPREIMEAAIKARNDKLDLTDKSDDYVAARFDAEIERADAAGQSAQRQAAKMGARSNADGMDKPRNGFDAMQAKQRDYFTKGAA